MSATDELRSLLERRGIRWEAPTGSLAGIRTIWSDGGWDMQADEATLGWFDVEAFRYASSPQAAAESPCGECHPTVSDNLTESEGTGDAWANCSECGYLLFVLTDPTSQVPNYCPGCGRKVVDG